MLIVQLNAKMLSLLLFQTNCFYSLMLRSNIVEKNTYMCRNIGMNQRLQPCWTQKIRMNYCCNKFPNAICFDRNNATSEQAYQIKANQVKQGHLIDLHLGSVWW